MLSINATQDAIIKHLRTNLKAYRSLDVAVKSANLLVMSASCIELDRACLGREFVRRIKILPYHNKPERIGFTFNGDPYGTFCDPTEVLIYCIWPKFKPSELEKPEVITKSIRICQDL